MSGVQKDIVSRDDHIYECFPDIATTPDGVLVCIYRECMAHAPVPFSRLVARRSLDGGCVWGEKEVLLECVSDEGWFSANREWFEADEIRGYEETRSRLSADWQDGATINCARMIALCDGSLFLVADVQVPGRGWVLFAWRSKDAGASWSEAWEVALERPGLVPSLKQLRDGRIMLGLNLAEQPERPGFYQPAVYFSEDGCQTWSKPILIPACQEYENDETSFVELDDGTLVGFGRNYAAEKAHRPSTAIKVISRDGGQTWSNPIDTWLIGCQGRPKAGILQSGEVCITYRAGLPNEMLAMHIMTQEAARSERLDTMVERKPLPEDIPFWRAKEKNVERPWYMTSYYPGRTLILDCDRSVHRDGGYSGWVQLPNGDIFVVDYINDDAPLAHIRSYRVRRSDYMMFPDGDLPWLHPSGQPFRRITAGMARRQFLNNRKRR